MGVDADRWMEIDLSWFDRGDPLASVRTFWERFTPLVRDVDGWKGVVVNAGWLVDHVLAWQGDLDARVPFPEGLVKDRFFSDTSPLLGSTVERKQQWRRRFEERSEHDTDTYPAWTYREVATVASLLRSVAQREFGVQDVLVGTFVIGWNSIYQCEYSEWSQKHPEAFFKGPWVDQLLNVPALLEADVGPYAAYPDGFPEATPLTQVFGKQWGALARDLGLDAIVLRDSMVGQGIYDRVGPWGPTAPGDPAQVQRWSEATADLVRQTKSAAPDTLVIGYSNAASAVADWRVNCVDLERIAHEGFLDAWIDQTWAGAWNEVGQREDMFWNIPLQGWTNQLGFVLLRAACLVGTKVRHYVLTETFDAWESWDIIHTAAQRLRWGIWAYLHAFVLTPAGPVAPRGTYVSWLNQGRRLLTEEDVDFLATHLDSATTHARDTVAVSGPTAVYSRSTMEWMTANAPEQTIKEYIDEQIGFLAKFGVPVTSSTRMEFVGQVQSDLLVFQTPHHLPDEQLAAVLSALDSAGPAAVFGSPAGGYHPRVADRLGLVSDEAFPTELRTTAVSGAPLHAAPNEGGEVDGPLQFSIRHLWSKNRAAPDADVIYTVDGSPALVRRGHLLAWDPCDVLHRLVEYTGRWDWSKRDIDEPTPVLMGSPQPYGLTARELNRLLAAAGKPNVQTASPTDTLTVAVWTSSDGTHTALLAELEEGFRSTTDGTWAADLAFSGQETAISIRMSYATSRLVHLRAGYIEAPWGLVDAPATVPPMTRTARLL